MLIQKQGKGYFRKSKAYGLVCGIALAGALVFSAGNVSSDEVTATDGSNGSAVVTACTQDNAQAIDQTQVSDTVQPASSEANNSYAEKGSTSSVVQAVEVDNIAITNATEEVNKQDVIKDDTNKEREIEQEQSAVSFSQATIPETTAYSSEIQGTAAYNTSQSTTQDDTVQIVKSGDAFTIDNAIQVTDKLQDGLTIRTITWDSNGPYHLEKAVSPIKDKDVTEFDIPSS